MYEIIKSSFKVFFFWRDFQLWQIVCLHIIGRTGRETTLDSFSWEKNPLNQQTAFQKREIHE